MALLEIENLTYHYPDENRSALDRINLTVQEGEFILLAGGSGSGKSSLVRAMAGLIPDFYGGKIAGAVRLDGMDIKALARSEVVRKVGMVFQDPESQLVMTTVEQELAFGMENLGLAPELMKRRIMEVSGALSLHGYLQENIPRLSGGLKQKTLLASILAMQPEILILDEPTSQLDPVAGEEILTVVRRLNEDNGITVILIEQRLERCFHLADRIVVMSEGRIIHDSPDRAAAAAWAVAKDSPFLPPLARLFAATGIQPLPLTVKEGRKALKGLQIPAGLNAAEGKTAKSTEKGVGPEDRIMSGTAAKKTPLLEVKQLWLTYDNGREVLKNINLTLNPAEFLIIMGENAAGKTTLLKTIRGLLRPSRGQVRLLGREANDFTVEALAQTVGYLAQNPNDYLFQPTVREEISFTLQNLGLAEDGRVEKILERFALLPYAAANPRDLSTGERQRAALAAILAADPPILLLDEPTRGLDYEMKASLGELLAGLRQEGHAIIVVTHDVEFAAEYAQKILFLSRGQIVSAGDKKEMLSRSTFYSSQIGKLFHGIDDSIVTLQDGAKALQKLLRGGKADAH
ncbi:MAG: ABC transporter ATP-binding protein [Clostridia bacterium]|nr:ABC transporter ATP-binding protein [Clostridia bacterium]